MINIAILGSNSHIAKSLIYNFSQSSTYKLCLFTTNKETTSEFLKKEGFENSHTIIDDYSTFYSISTDVIINCIGVGTSKKLNENYESFFTFPEKYDNMCCDYLRRHPECLYLTFSSGIVYGRLLEPAHKNTVSCFEVNNIHKHDYYSVAKLYTETKHRAFSKLNIVDLRVFSYFSKYINFQDNYFIIELIKSLLNKEEFIIVDDTFIRDYVHPEDLFDVIIKCIEIRKINQSIDVVSKSPVEKFEILDYFSDCYGLKYNIKKGFKHNSASGKKGVYYSNYKNALVINHKPKYSSLETLADIAKHFLGE